VATKADRVRDSIADIESFRPAQPVAGFNRNGWPTSVGIGGRIASESPAALRRITHHGHDLVWSEPRAARAM